MKLKGQTTFELTNVETGEKRVIKEDNMVTNGFKYLVQAGGTIGGGPHMFTRKPSGNFYNMGSNKSNGNNSKYATDVLLRYTNGLLLFPEKLEEDPEHIYVTADDPELVGVGAEIAYIGENKLAGSYNVNESGPIENGYKHVWDFTTSQANGDIGCVCLTTLMGASIGGGVGFSDVYSDWYGSFFSEYNHSVMNEDYDFPHIDDYFQNPISWAKLGYLDLGRNLFIRPKNYYAFPTENPSDLQWVQNEYDENGKISQKPVFDRTFLYKKSIDLDIYRFPYNNFSIFDKGNNLKQTSRYVTDTIYDTIFDSHLTYLKTVTINMPIELANIIPSNILEATMNAQYYHWPTEVDYDEGFMYISFMIPTTTGTDGIILNSGAKIYVWKINMNTFESDWFSITNTTGQSINMSKNFNVHDIRKQWIISNEYAILFSDPVYSRGNIWIIDTATGSTIKQVMTLDGTIYNKKSGDNEYFIRNNMLYLLQSAGNTVAYPVVINLKTGYAKFYQDYQIDRKYIYGRTYGTKVTFLLSFDFLHSPYRCIANFFIDPNVLMTINNLEDIVTKTSAETMKVTYILTQVDDGE